MFDPMLPMRLAQMTGEMFWRQTTATASLWSEMATSGVGAISAPASVPAPAPKPAPRLVRSWYRQPDSEPAYAPAAPAAPDWAAAFNPLSFLQPAQRPAMSSLPVLPFAFLAPFQTVAAPPVTPPTLPSSMLAPWQPWLQLWSQAAPQPTWPMAMMLMAAGFPRSAAFPAAEAGAHVMAATAKAAEGFEQLVSSYRSESGHATAQVIRQRRIH